MRLGAGDGTSGPMRVAAVEGKERRSALTHHVQRHGGREDEGIHVFEFHAEQLLQSEGTVHYKRHEVEARVLQQLQGDRGSAAGHLQQMHGLIRKCSDNARDGGCVPSRSTSMAAAQS